MFLKAVDDFVTINDLVNICSTYSHSLVAGVKYGIYVCERIYQMRQNEVSRRRTRPMGYLLHSSLEAWGWVNRRHGRRMSRPTLMP